MILLQNVWKCLNHLPGTAGQNVQRPEAGTPGGGEEEEEEEEEKEEARKKKQNLHTG